MEGAFSYNSELPGGRSPFWIKDDALAGIGLKAGDAVSVDSRAEPSNGDLVLVEIEADDDSEKIVRRYFEDDGEVVLKAANPHYPDVRVAPDQLFVVGLVRTKVRFEPVGAEQTRIIEEPLE